MFDWAMVMFDWAMVMFDCTLANVLFRSNLIYGLIV